MTKPKYKSKYEATIGASILPYAPYEPIKVKYVVPESHHTYTPDWVWGDFWIETKGKLDLDSRKKMLLIKAQYPDQKIVMVFQTPNAKINKGSPTSYKDWAVKNGFIVWTTAELMSRASRPF